MSPEIGSVLLRSTCVGLLCALLGAPVAILLGRWLARGRSIPKTVVGLLVAVPLVLPPVVTGLILLSVLSLHGPLGFLRIPFSFWGAVVAAFIVGLPLFVWTTRNAFESLDPRYAQLAATLGCSKMQTFKSITLPLCGPGVAAGAVLMFARALGEFGATSVLAGDIPSETRTLSLAVYALIDSPDAGKDVSVLVWCSIALCFASLLAYEAFRRWQESRLR